MNSFLDFINEDIETKNELISTLPTRTKKNKTEFNKKLSEMEKKYNEYEQGLRKYIEVKSKSFALSEEEKNVEDLENTVNILNGLRFILNPLNTYFEKMCFDDLIYQMNYYYDFNFSSLNEIINQFLDKFEMIGIKLNSKDFDYTYYVHEYMKAFLEAREKKVKNYDKVSDIFEKLYWANPEIIDHIELNFRKLIRNNARKFDRYISEIQKRGMSETKVVSYEDCLSKLETAYMELANAKEESVSDIIELAKAKKINMTDYFDGSKTRIGTYNELMVDPINLEDVDAMNKFYNNLRKLKNNLNEYGEYIKFLPILDNFRVEYENQIPKNSKDVGLIKATKDLKALEVKINKKESALDKVSKKTINDGSAIIEFRNKKVVEKSKVESIKLAKELYTLYGEYDQLNFKQKVLSLLSSTIKVSDVLYLYYSFGYFKKVALKKAFDLKTYDEIIEYNNEYDAFATNPLNIIIDGMPVFGNNDIIKIISNKHKLNNINLTEDVLSSGELDSILGKIQMLIRINNIENSETTVEKVWFIGEATQIINAKKDEKEETSK